jgi:hypothetical protein
MKNLEKQPSSPGFVKIQYDGLRVPARPLLPEMAQNLIP